MKAPLERDLQIELMRNGKERMESRAESWKGVPVIRDSLKRPAPNQDTGRYKRSTVRVTRCG